MNRQKYLDIVKGISILCIVLLHYLRGFFPEPLHVFVGSFMITAFYVVAGWLTAMRTHEVALQDFISKRFKQLVVPYLWWSGIILVLEVLLLLVGVYDTQYIGKEIYKTLTLRGIGTLWFLPALFGAEIIWHYLRTCRRKYACTLIALLLTVGYQIVYAHCFKRLDSDCVKLLNAPFRTLLNILDAWVAVAFGFCAYHLLNKMHLCRFSGLLLGVLIFSVSYVVANYYPFGWAIGWKYMAPLWGPLGLICIVKALPDFLGADYLVYWGRNSLNLMLTHYSITLVLVELFVTSILGIEYVGWITFTCFILMMPVQHLWVIGVNKYAKFTLGK